jgi:hypothetical protein
MRKGDLTALGCPLSRLGCRQNPTCHRLSPDLRKLDLELCSTQHRSCFLSGWDQLQRIEITNFYHVIRFIRVTLFADRTCEWLRWRHWKINRGLWRYIGYLCKHKNRFAGQRFTGDSIVSSHWHRVRYPPVLFSAIKLLELSPFQQAFQDW